MQILVTIDGAKPVSGGVWQARVEPANVRQLGTPAAEVGERSIILLDKPAYDSAGQRVVFPINGSRVLNLGTSDIAILVSAASEVPRPQSGSTARRSDKDSIARETVALGLGDHQLLRMVDSFPPAMKDAAAAVVCHVRQVDPNGDFERHRNRFVNRRDNFVAIEPQTRKQQLLLNVRGKVATSLPTLSTFNGYTAFKLSAPEDLPMVLQAIDRATRKRF